MDVQPTSEYFENGTCIVYECILKEKIEISVSTGVMLNDHSNPYTERTTLLSDN